MDHPRKELTPDDGRKIAGAGALAEIENARPVMGNDELKASARIKLLNL